MPCHAYLMDAAFAAKHVERHPIDKLDARTLEILAETIDRDIKSFLPILEEYRRNAPDLVADAEKELATARHLRTSLAVALTKRLLK